MDENNANPNAISDARTERSYQTCYPSRGASGGTLVAELQILSNDCLSYSDLEVLQDQASTKAKSNAHTVEHCWTGWQQEVDCMQAVTS